MKLQSLPRSRERAAALVIVLSILVILMVLLLAFFSLVRSEQRSSAIFSEAVEARNLADLPANLVIAQIRRATENNAPGMANGTQFMTWASQPGMLRTFGVEMESAASVRSKTVGLYKLYSDDMMVVRKASATSTTGGMTTAEVGAALKLDTDDLATWQERPGLFTDLNEPAPVLSGGSVNLPEYEFPIVDPRAAAADGVEAMAVEGFTFGTKLPAGTVAPTVAGLVEPTGRSDTRARLPMPVRWIYVLQDGSLTTPTSGDAERSLF